jgi:excisionase family DNA binding protein
MLAARFMATKLISGGPHMTRRSAMTDVGTEALGLLTMAQVADLLNLSEKTIGRMIRQGVFTKLKVGSLVRIDPAEVVAYKKQLHEQAKAS